MSFMTESQRMKGTRTAAAKLSHRIPYDGRHWTYAELAAAYPPLAASTIRQRWADGRRGDDLVVPKGTQMDRAKAPGEGLEKMPPEFHRFVRHANP